MNSPNTDDSSRAPAPAPALGQNRASESSGGANGSQDSGKTHHEQCEELGDRIETGQVTAKTLRDLIVAIPDVRVLIVATAVRCLGAERMMGGGKKGEVERCADGATQMKAVAFLAAYADGLPVQTTMNLNVDGTKDMPMEELLAKSPALVAAMERQLERAKAVQKRGPLKQVGPPSGPSSGS